MHVVTHGKRAPHTYSQIAFPSEAANSSNLSTASARMPFIYTIVRLDLASTSSFLSNVDFSKKFQPPYLTTNSTKKILFPSHARFRRRRRKLVHLFQELKSPTCACRYAIMELQTKDLNRTPVKSVRKMSQAPHESLNILRHPSRASRKHIHVNVGIGMREQFRVYFTSFCHISILM